MSDYFSQTLIIANKMQANGENMGGIAVVENIVLSMTPKSNYIVCSIMEYKDTYNVNIDELQCSLLIHEQSMSSHVQEQHALKITQGDQDDQYVHYEERGQGFGRRG